LIFVYFDIVNIFAKPGLKSYLFVPGTNLWEPVLLMKEWTLLKF